MINLDSRLSAILDAIKPCEVLIDIGTDHGKIPVKALLENKCKLAIAGDISSHSLEKAKKLAVKMSVSDRLSCRLGDGICTILPHEYDTLVIAGMGGLEIATILSKASQKFSRYILLPHRNTRTVREFLVGQDIAPQQDFMVECNGKFYSLIVASAGKYCPSEMDLKYGMRRDDAVFKSYLSKEIARLDGIARKTGGLNASNDIQLKEILSLYESIRSCQDN